MPSSRMSLQKRKEKSARRAAAFRIRHGIPERQAVPSINKNAEENLVISEMDLIKAIDAVLEGNDMAGQINKDVDVTNNLQQPERPQMEQRTCPEEPEFVLDVLAREEDYEF